MSFDFVLNLSQGLENDLIDASSSEDLSLKPRARSQAKCSIWVSIKFEALSEVADNEGEKFRVLVSVEAPNPCKVTEFLCDF